MLIDIKISGYSSFDLALIRWYDFRHKNDIRRLYKYDCPWLQLTDIYNFVPVDSIIALEHVIQRAEQQNEYFVNIYMF
jgi:hypothetical protein